MRKSTLFLGCLIGSLAAGSLSAEEGLQDQTPVPALASVPHSAGMAQATLFASAEMPVSQRNNPLFLLPGMRPEIPTGAISASIPSATGSPTRALPPEIITDLMNAPNPFDSRKGGLAGETEISYSLAQSAPVTVTIYDLLGHKVRGWSFVSGGNGGQQGQNSFLWDGTNEANQKVSKGGYIAEVVVTAPQTSATAILKIGVIH